MPRVSKKDKPAQETVELIEAIKFCAVAQREIGLPYQTHIIMRANTALAFDGVLTVGTRTGFDISTAPHTLRFLAALQKCKSAYSVTQTESGQLIVKSGAFRAVVPCLPVDDLATNWPDNASHAVDGAALKRLFGQLVGVISEGATSTVASSLLLTRNSMVVCDRYLLIEAWHGLDLPGEYLLPKAFIQAVAKCPRAIVALGFGETSVTFWFDDNSFIKSQVHSEKYPDYNGVFARADTGVAPVPETLVEAIKAVAPFSEDGAVYFSEKQVASHLNDVIGATHDCKGLRFEGKPNLAFNIGRIMSALSVATAWNMHASERGMYFVGEGIRGMLSLWTSDAV